MHRSIVALAVVVATAAVLASAAFADQPTRYPIGNGSFTINGVCSFNVDATLLADNEFEMDFSNGATIITGRLVYRLTNDTTHKSLVVNISGPGFFTADTTLLTGNSLIFGFASPSGLFLTRGPVTPDTNGSFTTTSAATVDLCAALS